MSRLVVRTRRIASVMGFVAFAAVVSLGPAATAETFRPVVRGKRGAVAAGHPLSAEAGLRLLQQGGNAIDAGCAALLAASVIEFSHFSFGGEAPVIVHRPSAGAPEVVAGQGTAPKSATAAFFLDRARKGARDTGPVYAGAPEYVAIKAGGAVPGTIPSSGLLAATVPAVLDTVVLALDRHGTKSLSQVMQPAIELADGFPIDEVRVRYIETTRKIFERWPTTTRTFLPGGRVPKVGEIFRQPDLARTLRDIASAERKAGGARKDGLRAARDHFYKGPIGKTIGDFSEKNGGLLRAADLAGFAVAAELPARVTYRGYEILKTGFWAQGPVMLQALNLLEATDLRALGHNSPDYIHRVVEALKLAFADRDRYYGDPLFSAIPAAELLSKDYAAARRGLIDSRRASLDERPGDPTGMRARRGEVVPPPKVPPSSKVPATFPGPSGPPALTGPSAVPEALRAKDTTCVNVIDADGNAFSATPSGAWLPAVVAGNTGVMLPQRLQAFVLEAGHPNVLEPGKRPRITLSPTLVLKDGKPVIALSTPGGDNQDQALLQVLLNIVDFGMNVQEAIEAPRFQSLHFRSSFDDHRFNPGVLSVEDRVPAATIADLASRGHKVTADKPWGTPSAPTAVMIDRATGVIHAGADPRRGRYAIAW